MNRGVLLVVAASAATGMAQRADAQAREFIFAGAGTSYTGVIFQGDPIIGQESTHARILLTITVNAGGNAADFAADISFPIDPFPGSTNVLNISGIEEGWSGTGTFSIDRTVTAYNGTFRAGLFGAETILMNGFVHEGSVVQFFTVPAPASAGLLALGTLAAIRRRR
jgi:hypothetical protein